MENTPIIDVHGLSCKSGNNYLLHDVNWKVYPGEHWVVFGLNGSGKTTLLGAVAGFQPYTHGTLRVFGEEYSDENIFRLRRRIGFVSSSFFDKVVAEEAVINIVLSGLFGSLGVRGKVSDRARVEAEMLLATFGLEEKIDYGNRNMLLTELSEDGNEVHLWMSKAFDIAHDTLFHPRSIYKQVVENCGHIPPNPTFGGKQLDVINKIMLPTWEVLCQWQADALNYLIDTNGYQVVFSHIHNVDAMGHMFWYYGKNRPIMGKMEEEGYQAAIEEVYLQTDRYLGRFLHYLDEGWTITIFSDHGLLTPEEEEKPLIGDAFGCNVGVLSELGYTVLKKDENGNPIKEIDWEKTRAVATRGGQIYINLKGKYPTGIVDPADKYELERQIIDDLYSYRLNGKRVISVAMRNKDAVNLGTGGPECGDILYWLEEGVNRLHGDALPEVQGYEDTCVTPIFIAAGKGFKQGYECERIIRQADMAPTLAYMLGVRMPKQCEGAVAYQILEDSGI